MPAWQKLEGYFKNVLAKQMANSLSFATPRTKDVERRPCRTNTHTYTLFSSSFHGRFSPQISFCDPRPTALLSFSFFLWMETGFEAKSAFVPSRFVNLPTPYEPSCIDIQFYYNLKKYIRRYTVRIAQRWSSTPFKRFKLCSPIETGRWKEIFFHEQKPKKRFAKPEIKMPHMRTSVLHPV